MIRTDNLYLDELTSKDAYSYYKIVSSESDFLLMEYTPFFRAASEYYSRIIIQDYYFDKRHLFLGIYKTNGSNLIGAILIDYNFFPSISLSYFIGEKYRGNKYMYEALQGLINNFQKTKEIAAMFFYVRNDNIQSIKTLNSLSFASKSKISQYVDESYVKYKIIL